MSSSGLRRPGPLAKLGPMLARLGPPTLALALLGAAAAARAAEPAASLLVNGSFELLEGGRPVAWTLKEGARSSGGTLQSEWFLGRPAHSGERSLRLRGSMPTASWLLFESDPVAVEADRLVRLSGWIRTEDVRREVRQWSNASVGVRFLDAAGEPVAVDGYRVSNTPALLGTRDWTRVERVLRVPEGAVRATVHCFLSLSGTAWFDDVGLEPIAEPDWIVTSTERFVFHEQEGARLSAEQRAANEVHLAELEGLLQLRLPHPVDYYLYRDEAQKLRVTGRSGAAHAELPGRLHSTRPTDRHELVHLLTALVGPAECALFGEGLAVHLAGGHEGRPADEIVRELAVQGRLPPLAELVDWGSFGRLDRDVSFPVAGSFIGFLVETGGLDAFKQLYPRHGRESGLEVVDRRLRERYGVGLAELEETWRTAVLGG